MPLSLKESSFTTHLEGMDSSSTRVPGTGSLRFVDHSEAEEQAANFDDGGSITGNDIKEAPSHTNAVVASTQMEDNLDTKADDGGCPNTMPLLNSGFLYDPEPLIYAGPGPVSAFLSGSAQSQTLLAPFIQQYHGEYTPTIDQHHSFAPNIPQSRSTETSVDFQKDCHLCHLSPSLSIHKLTAIDGGPLFNSQAQSSFNSPLPHCHIYSENRTPLCAYLGVARSPSPADPRKTFKHLDNMTWSSSSNQNMYSSYVPNDETDQQDMSAPHHSTYWQASLHPNDGEEGVTPYLRQQQFDKAEVVLDINNTNVVDNAVIFDNVEDAMTWRARTRTLNYQTSADPTIPRTTPQKKAAVKLLFKAFKSVAHATDNPHMKKAFDEQKHDNRQVEVLCWTIVEACIDRCDRGPLLNAFEPEKAKNNPSIATFAQRLDAIVETMSRQKTICKHILDPPYMYRVVDDPFGSKQRVESNRKLNKKKGSVMNAGKKSLGITGQKGRPAGGKKSIENSDDGLDDFDSEYREYPGDSSGISSPFRTPDEPVTTNLYRRGALMGVHQRDSLETYLVEAPTGHRIRGDTPITSSPLRRTRSAQTSYGEHFGSAGGTNSQAGFDFQPTSTGMNMMRGSMVDPALSSYTSNYSHGMPQTSGIASPFQSPAGAVSNYDNTLHDPFANTSPTSAPFGMAEPVLPELDNKEDAKFSPLSSDDLNASDDEYIPGDSSRKRQRRR